MGKPQSQVVREAIAEYASRVSRPRGRELDLAIAATAILHDATFWTLNPRDFGDIPRLRLLAHGTRPVLT